MQTERERERERKRQREINGRKQKSGAEAPSGMKKNNFFENQ